MEWIEKFILASNNHVLKKENMRVVWMRNPTNHNSLRLTHQCLSWLNKNTQIKCWTIKVGHRITGKQLVQLERLFTSPYFLAQGGITLFSETDYIMLQLHAGNLSQYLDNLQL